MSATLRGRGGKFAVELLWSYASPYCAQFPKLDPTLCLWFPEAQRRFESRYNPLCLRWYLHERKHKGPLLLVPLLRLLPIRKSE